jgi:tartrate/fumarate subfamily iron-sulfur-dependent hydro-lyase beta chain
LPDLNLPISEEQIRSLRVGDTVSLTGIMYTARDAAHKYMVENFVQGETPASEVSMLAELEQGLQGGIIYHCGPVVRKDEQGKWHFVAAGPTTSIREEPYEYQVIERFGVRAVIGKGGMADKTLQACQDHGAVYLHAIGGAASLIARSVVEVVGLFKEEFGLPEAFWKIRVKDFQCVVTMDSTGGSLHKVVEALSRENLQEILK